VPVTPTVTYPGVYVQEIPSSVHTIMGVSTSVTAFVGRALRGPVNEPMIITNFADFERTFGGVWSQSYLGYAVQDFYMNGGSQAIIVRLFRDTPLPAPGAGTSGSPASSGSSSTPAGPGGSGGSTSAGGGSSSTPTSGSAGAPTAPGGAATPKSYALLQVTGDPKGANALPLEASNPGAWGNSLRARISAVSGALFTLSVFDPLTGLLEIFRNISVTPGAQAVDTVLATQSNLVRVPKDATLPSAPPAAHAATPARGKTIWTDDTTSTGVASAGMAFDGYDLGTDDFIDIDTPQAPSRNLQANKAGLYTLERADLFNLLCIPPHTPDNDIDPELLAAAAAYCEQRRAMLIVDPPLAWTSTQAAMDAAQQNMAGALGTTSANAMVYFPRLLRPNFLDKFVPCGAIAGVIARTDAQRGVWKAPAGLEATLNGISQLSVPLTDAENGILNPLAINCLRVMAATGPVVWGARTLQGNDNLASQWKYIPVRRLALYIEESLYRGTKWAVFEPNADPLWSQLRLNIGVFMNDLFRQGAFQGTKPQDAYFVQCDSTTTTQSDIDRGIVNIIVGFAPLKPAEFVILYLQQIAGQLAV
jgi:phage tail sheath protein FI